MISVIRLYRERKEEKKKVIENTGCISTILLPQDDEGSPLENLLKGHIEAEKMICFGFCDPFLDSRSQMR